MTVVVWVAKSINAFARLTVARSLPFIASVSLRSRVRELSLSFCVAVFMVSPVGCGCVRNTMINPAGDATILKKAA